jgi:FtsH-binding integral membrane protein
MTSTDVTTLTNAFDPTNLLGQFENFAPYIISVIGVLIAVGLVRWAFHKIRRLLSRGV